MFISPEKVVVLVTVVSAEARVYSKLPLVFHVSTVSLPSVVSVAPVWSTTVMSAVVKRIITTPEPPFAPSPE